MFSFVLENVDKGSICTIELDAQKVKQFSDAIESSYWFELFIGMEKLILFHSDAHYFIVPSDILSIQILCCFLLWSNHLDDLPLWGKCTYSFMLHNSFCPLFYFVICSVAI
jgi:hypothetical protein